MKIRLNEKNLFYVLVILTPFIDVINALIRITGVSSLFSFGQIIRIIILLAMGSFVLKCNKKYSRYIFALLLFLLLHDLLQSIFCSIDISQNITYNLRYFYVLTFGMALFTSVQRQKINESDLYSLIKIITSVVAVISLVSSLFGFGLDYAGTKRVFTEVNALTAILVVGCGVYIYEIVFNNKRISTVVLTLIMIVSTVLQATKTGLIGIVICGAFIYFYVGFVRKKVLKQFEIFLLLVGTFFLLEKYYLQGQGTAIFSRWNYFYTGMDTVSFLLSGRNDMMITTFDLWINHPISAIFGFGFSLMEKLIYAINQNQSFVGAEMDIFDLYFLYGVIIASMITVPLFKNLLKCFVNLFKNNISSYYTFLYIIMFFVSFLGGHVLNSPLAGIVFCLLYCLTYGHNNQKFGNEWI